VIDSSRYCRRARKSPAPARRRPSSAIIGKDSVGTVGGGTVVGGVLVGVAVLIGVPVGVFVGVLVGVLVGVAVLVGVFVGVLVGVLVGVGVHARICVEFVVAAETGPPSVPVAEI
jgi:hypothetical protein